jgi:aminocarboxymuconate-semialdehyde decarboxylase
VISAAGPALADVHAHHFGRDLTDWAEITGDPRWPSLRMDDGGSGRIMLGDEQFRPVKAPLWDLAARIEVLDAHGVAVQVISPTPIMLTYWGGPKPARDFARGVNDSLAADVASSAGRLVGLGTLPLQDVTLAVAELERVMGDLGLAGVEIGTNIAGRELDDPELEPFWAAAADLDASVFTHPLDGGGGAIRRTGQPYDFGLGMLTDTAMAATALICGGVLDRHPRLRVGMSHGCGTFAWAAPRVRIANQLTSNPEIIDRFDDLVTRLWVDTLVFDPEHLRLLVRRFGAGHVMLGTDFPFIPGQIEGAHDFISSATADGVISPVEAEAITTANALDFITRRK